MSHWFDDHETGNRIFVDDEGVSHVMTYSFFEESWVIVTKEKAPEKNFDLYEGLR